MINEEKVKIMNRLAMYEKRGGKKYLPVSRYYRSDYIGLALIKNFFLVTIGYALVLAAVAVYYSEYLMNNINQMDLVSLGMKVLCCGADQLFGSYLYCIYCEISLCQEKC